MYPGEEKAWERLAGLNPDDVARRAAVSHDADSASYVVESLGHRYAVSPGTRKIRGMEAAAEELLARQRDFLALAVVWYLGSAREAGATGRLIRPEDLRGGHHFFRSGTHQLPLARLAETYGSDAEGFLERGRALAGRRLSYGDESVELRPLPRVPVTLILWVGDDEFPPRCDLLFDSSAELQAPLDIIWSAAMLALGAML